MARIRILSLVTWLLASSAMAQSTVSWIGNTKLWPAFGGGNLPTRASYLEPNQSLTVTTQTFPISQGQTVRLVYTTNNWITSTEVPLNFDFNVGNNSQWYGIVGPFASGSQVQFYLRANGSDGSVRWDNNNSQNYGFYSRFAPRFRNSTILQWFDTDYRTMLKRLPEVVEAGYGALYLPPPTKSGGGGFSVGFNPFDRFDFGDRLSMGTVRTRYGTTQELFELIEAAKRFGLEVYCDVVFNHNDNRASTPINRYPDMIPEDFHIRSSADTSNAEVDFNTAQAFDSNMLTGDLVGLADIAHEDGNYAQAGPFTLPSYATFNSNGKPSFVRHPKTPQFYPNGVPVEEDVREYLKRWGWLLTNVLRFDGYRFDAIKHTMPGFFDAQWDQPGGITSRGDLLPYLYSLNPEIYTFGEGFTSNAYELREYAKSGMNLLDFPLRFKQSEIFNSQGFGSLSTISNGYGLDAATGLPYELGGLGKNVGVGFVQTHDDGPAQSNNLAHAFVLTRPARAKVYFDGNNIQSSNWSNFPRPGRYDALGSGDDYVRPIIDARNRFGRGVLVNRVVENNFYAYERMVNGRGLLLVGLNNRGDLTALTRTVQTAFAPGTELEDLSGQRPNITVNAQGQATITVPSNSTSTNSNNARGYVLYAPIAPKALPNIEPVRLFDATSNSELPYVVQNLPSGAFATPRSFRAATLTSNWMSLKIETDGTGFSAAVKLDGGEPIGDLAPMSNTPEGLTDGYVQMPKTQDGLFVANNLDVSHLSDGLHVLRVRVFKNTGSEPGVFRDFVAWFYLQRSDTVTIDGDLSDTGTVISSQTRTPSNNNNRLDILYANNDDKFLYLGLAGNVDTAENLTNGIALYLDMDPRSGTGLSNLAWLDDDSGPATRLLSQHNVHASRQFGADFAIGVFRRSQLGSSPEALLPGDPVYPKPIGAFAGAYRITENMKWLEGVPAAIAWKPRWGAFDPPAGMEVKIPIESLRKGYRFGNEINLLAFHLNTGELGQTLVSTNAARGVTGGYAFQASSVRNQFLPPQTNIVSDPFTSTVTARSFAAYGWKYTKAAISLSYTTLSTVTDPTSGITTQRIRITNGSGQSIGGPIYAVAVLGGNGNLLDQRGISAFTRNQPYIRVSTSAIAAGASIEVDIRYKDLNGATPMLVFRHGFGMM